jgi:hypothetical protein
MTERGLASRPRARSTGWAASRGSGAAAAVRPRKTCHRRGPSPLDAISSPPRGGANRRYPCGTDPPTARRPRRGGCAGELGELPRLVSVLNKSQASSSPAWASSSSASRPGAPVWSAPLQLDLVFPHAEHSGGLTYKALGYPPAVDVDKR